MKILNFGSINIDRIFSVNHIVRPGETLDSTTYEETIGGKGLNQSIALARVNNQVFHAGIINKNDNFVIDYLKNNNVNITYISKSNLPTGSAFIQVDKKGENSIVLYHGANYEINERFIDSVLNDFSRDDVLLIQNEISSLDYLINSAYDKGMFIALNLSPINQSLFEIDINKIDLIIMNETEAQALTKQDNKDKIIEKIKITYPNLKVIITLGREGSLYFDNDDYIVQKSFDLDSIDTTGAGDSFTGYFLGYFIETNDIRKSLLYASAAGGLSVTKKGASTSIPHKEEVEEFLKYNTDL